MESARLFSQSAEIIVRLRGIALSTNQCPCKRLRPAECMASVQFAAVAFRLSGRGVF